MKKWISVDDRLPEDGKLVLAITMQKSAHNLPSWSILQKWTSEESGNWQWYDALRTYRHFRPTHWMPLPEPPTKED